MNRRHLARIALVPVAAAAIALTAACGTPVALGADIGQAPAPLTYSEGLFSISATITNNTDQVWTFDPAHSNVDEGDSASHWGTRPQATLQPGAKETVTAYTWETGGFDLTVSYTLPDGEFAVFQVVDDVIGRNNTAQGVYIGWADNGNTGTPDPAYTGTGSAGHGNHITAEMQIAKAS